MPTPGIKDVAALAEVSVGTVSNVLNRPDRVSAGTRAKVEGAIAQLGFVRNESARQLRAGRSRMLAYLVLDAANPFFTDVARGVEEAVREAGLGLFLCDSSTDLRREHDYLELMLEHRVRGVLITPVDRNAPDLRMLVKRGIPVVLVDRAEGAAWCSVSVDDVEGGDLAVTHLLEQGHERIAVVGGPLTTVQVRDRHEGAVRAVKRTGLDPREVLTVLDTPALNVAEGRRAGERLAGLPSRRRPSAAFCANDLVALGMLQEMTRQGLGVPDDLAIVGYDDIEFASAAAVPLTSVRQPRHELGRTAAQLLLREATEGVGALDGDKHVHQQVEFQPELVVRSSSRRRQSSTTA